MCCPNCRRQPLVTDPYACTCPTSWGSIIPPPPCPVHGQLEMLTVTCNNLDSLPTVARFEVGTDA